LNEEAVGIKEQPLRSKKLKCVGRQVVSEIKILPYANACLRHHKGCCESRKGAFAERLYRENTTNGFSALLKTDFC
jgi:hypothetical protein